MYRPKNYSWSASNAFNDCGQKVYYKRVLGLPERPGVGLLLGTLGDEIVMGTNGYFADVIRTGEPEPNRDYATDFEKDANQRFKEIRDSLYPEEQDEFSESIPRVKTLIQEYCQPECTMHKHLKPIAIQSEYNVRFKGLRVPIRGYSDLVAYHADTERYVVVDMKVQKRKANGGTVGQRYQIGFYGFAEMMKRDLDYLPAGEIHCFVRKKNPELEHSMFPCHQDDVTQVLQLTLNYQFGIESNYWPLNRQSNLCNPKYCSFYDRCHKDNERDIQVLKDLYEETPTKENVRFVDFNNGV